MIPPWASVCGYAAAATSIVSAATQTARVVRARSAVGIATATWLIGSLASISWFAYGLSIRSPQQAIANGSWMFFVASSTWFMLLPRGRTVAWRGIAVACAVFVALLTLGSFVPAAPGWIGTPASLMMTTPQVIHSIRHGRGPGISLLGWTFLTISSFLWFAYGIGAREWPVVFNTSLGSLLALAVVVTLAFRPQGADRERISVAA